MHDASTASLSFASGGEIALVSDEPRTLAERIAERVAAKPNGIIRSYRGDGRHQARSHAWLWRQAGDIAAALCAAGVAPATPVIILAEDVLDFAPSFWGCLKAATVPVALMSAAKAAIHHKDPAFSEAAALLEASVFIVDEDFAALMPRLPLRPDSRVLHIVSTPPVSDFADRTPVRDIAYLVATSGSTGRLKLVELSTQAVIYRNFARGWSIEPSSPEPQASHAIGNFPLDTVTGQHVCFLHCDSVTQISSHTLTVRPTSILDVIEAFDIDTVTLTNSMINRIMAQQVGDTRARRLGSLRIVGLGAEPVSARLGQEFSAMLTRHGADPGVVIAGYGTTETGSLVAGSRALLTSDGAQPVCLGRPWHGVAMRIVDDGGVLPAGEVGALEVLCPAKMFARYWGDARLTAESFTADGWWKTGDLGQLIDGELTLRGRTKEVLIQNARKLSLADIDAEVQTVLGVGAAAHAFLLVDSDTQAETLGVAFDTGGTMAEALAIDTIRAGLVRRFGLQPQMIIPIPSDRMPRTAAGKVRRAALGQMAAGLADAPGRPMPAEVASQTIPSSLTRRLEAIWSEVLGLQRPVRAEDHFFNLGGDSLRALTLHLQLADAFGVLITGEEFFADPTFRSLLRLVRAAPDGTSDVPPRENTPWPLPKELNRGLLAALDQWPGTRAVEAGTILGFNLDGDRPPIVWVFNAPQEPVNLAQALGPGQPLYAIRSGHNLSDYSEDDIQTFALHYVGHIMRLRPTGTLFVAGNCQGAIIALAIAQHLLRRKRHIPLLVLMDWAFELQAYPGRVLFVASADNPMNNPRFHFAKPELAWARAFTHHDFAPITGGYGRGFDPEHIPNLVRALADHMPSALSAPPILVPDSGYHATVTADKPPVDMRPGERRSLWVSLTNDSDITWAPSAASGILLSSKWLRHGLPLGHPPQPRATIPRLHPRETATVKLNIVAPYEFGELTLVLDPVEEGNRWFTAADEGRFAIPVQVVERTMWRLLRSKLGID